MSSWPPYKSYTVGIMHYRFLLVLTFVCAVSTPIIAADNAPKEWVSLKACLANGISTRLTQEFSQSGKARCPGGGCFLQSGRCNLRTTKLTYKAPSNFHIDTYRFEPIAMNDGSWSKLETFEGEDETITSISVTLTCDPPNHVGAGGGWSEGALKGVIRHSKPRVLLRQIRAECDVLDEIHKME